jgi:hypothetical protein
MPDLMDPEMMKLLVDREVVKDMQREQAQRSMEIPGSKETPKTPKSLSPKQALILGSLADSASTYAFLKQGGRREANPAMQHFNKRPWMVLPTAAAGAAGYSMLYDLIKKRSGGLADTMAGLVGGLHGALAGSNAENVGHSSYRQAITDLEFPQQRKK